MTSTRRGRGQAQVDACGRGRGQALCGRPHRKVELSPLMSSCLLLMQLNFSFSSRRSLYKLFQESNVYFMSTTCGRPERGGWLMCTHVDRGEGSKIRFFCGRHKWIAPSCGFIWY